MALPSSVLRNFLVPVPPPEFFVLSHSHLDGQLMDHKMATPSDLASSHSSIFFFPYLFFPSPHSLFFFPYGLLRAQSDILYFSHVFMSSFALLSHHFMICCPSLSCPLHPSSCFLLPLTASLGGGFKFKAVQRRIIGHV